MTQVSQSTLNFIAERESFIPTAYKDGNHYSIGYGSYATPAEVASGAPISKADATERLRAEAQKAQDYVDNTFHPPGGLNPNQNTSLVSMMYNTGSAGQTLIDAVNSGDTARAQAAMNLYHKAENPADTAGVINRRNVEVANYGAPVPPGSVGGPGAGATGTALAGGTPLAPTPDNGERALSGGGTTRYAGTTAPQGPYGFDNFVNTITSGGSADAIKAAGAAVSAQVSALPLLSQLGALQQINSYIKALPQTAPGAVQFLQNTLHTNPELLNDPALKPLLPAITAAIGTPVNPVALPNLSPFAQSGNALSALASLNPNQIRGLEGPNYVGPTAGPPAQSAPALVAGGAPFSASAPPASAYAASPGDLALQNALNSVARPQSAWNPRTLFQLQQGANQVDALAGTQGSRNAVNALSAASLANGGANIGGSGAGSGAGGLTSWGALNPNQQRGLAGGSSSDESYRGNSTMWTPGQTATPPNPQVRESWSSSPSSWSTPTPTPSPLGNQGSSASSYAGSSTGLSAWDRNALSASASAPAPSAWDAGLSTSAPQYWTPPSDTSYQGSSATSYTPSAPSSYLDRNALSAPSGFPAPSAWDAGLSASPQQYWTPPAASAPAPSYSAPATSSSAYDPNAYDPLANASVYNTMLPRSSANALSAASASGGSAGSAYTPAPQQSSYQQPSSNSLPELTGWSGSSGQGMGSLYGD